MLKPIHKNGKMINFMRWATVETQNCRDAKFCVSTTEKQINKENKWLSVQYAIQEKEKGGA